MFKTAKKIEEVEFSNGVKIPQLGLGTWKLKGAEARDTVTKAIDMGYRHVDTASMYQNEREVGEAIKNSEVGRDSVFITSKMWSNEKDDPRAALERSLKNLDTDYLDLYLIHWPSGGDLKTWRVFEEMYEEGLCKAIGVSNFDSSILKNSIVKNCKIKPMLNQIEMCPGQLNMRLLRYAHNEDVAITAYSPLSKATEFDKKEIQEIAASHNKSPAQVMLRWSIEHRAVVIPKASSEEHLKENMDIFDFELSNSEVRKLDTL